MKNKYAIIALVIVCCAFMAAVELFIEPAYAVKSALKAAAFLAAPFVVLKLLKISPFGAAFKLDKRAFMGHFALGAGVYAAIMLGYLFTKNLFDYAALVSSLSSDQKVGGFWPAAIYISFANSFLEEFLFRQIAFIRLKEHSGRAFAYVFSSLAFSIYHVAMIGQSFPPALLFLSLIGLAVGGVIFNLADEKSENIYNSWFIHMFADFALMTVWRIYI